MKHTTHFVSTRLVSLVLSLFLVFGTAASSLSAVTDLSIAEQTAPAASYGVAEGSLLAQPADDDVLDIALDDDTPAAAPSAPLTLSRDKNTDLAATGDAVTSLTETDGTKYYIGSDPSNYILIRESGNWHIKRTTDNSYITGFTGSAGVTRNVTWSTSTPVAFTAQYNSWGTSGWTLSSDSVYLNSDNLSSATTMPNAAKRYSLYENASVAPTEAPTVAPTVAPTEAPTVAPTVAPTEASTVAPTEAPSESTSSDSITYTKQIEKKYPNNDDDYNYRLHLSVDGSKLKETTTTTSNKKVGIAILIDMAGDQRATWGNDSYGRPIYKKDVIRQYINKYLSAYKNVASVNISIIAVKGSQSQPYNNPSVTNILSEWDEYKEIDDTTYTNNTITYGANYTAGLIRAQEYLTDKTENGNKEFDYNSIVFITNQNPLFGALDNGNYDSSQGTGSEGFAKDNVLSYLDRVFIPEYTTNLHIIDVPNENSTANHTTPVAMSDKLIAAKRGSFTSATSASDLDTAIGNAIESILAGDKTKSLTVSDTLSANVDFASNKYLTAILYTGANLATQNEVSGAVTIDGKTVTFDQSKLAQISGLSSLAEIDGPFKLEIAFDIKTIVSGQSYPDTGDDGTDYSSVSYNHNFSANKPGYYANSSATINYTLNGTAKSGTFKHPVVQAPAEAPVQGKYIFKYIDRYGDERTVEVPVTLNSDEKKGYSGNNDQQNVPTFLWTADAKTLFPNNPLVTAALRVDGNAELEDGEAQKDVSVYKHTIEWANLNTETYTEGSNVSYSSADHTVTVTANTPVMTFTFNYKIVKDGYVLEEKAATGIPYGRAVTFHPQYSDTSKYAYINDTIPSEGFSYWSADEAGNIPITTNLTFGMLIRGDFRHEEDDETVVTVYAQYGKNPSKDWNPLIEEAKLTHTIDDNVDWLYLDYMTNYLSKDGSVVKDMIDAGNNSIRYGIVAVKHDGTNNPDQPKMIKIAQAMITKNKQSAYLDSSKQTIAYRYEYGNPTDDVKPISNFNRVLYTLRTDTEKAQNHTFSAIAYITVDGTNYFYSAVNSDIVIHDLVENN